MRDLKSRIPRAAASPFSVVIEGESGTGKELIARAIHEEGAARSRGLRAGQLRGSRRRAVRVGAVRPRQGSVHRSGARPEGPATPWCHERGAGKAVPLAPGLNRVTTPRHTEAVTILSGLGRREETMVGRAYLGVGQKPRPAGAGPAD